MRSIQLPPGIEALVRSTGQPQTVTGILSENGVPISVADYTIYLDEDTIKSVPVAEWAAEQARLAQKEADRQQAAQVKAQVLGALQAMAGRPANGTYTAKELQALIMALVHKVGGINKAGELRAPGEWL